MELSDHLSRKTGSGYMEINVPLGQYLFHVRVSLGPITRRLAASRVQRSWYYCSCVLLAQWLLGMANHCEWVLRRDSTEEQALCWISGGVNEHQGFLPCGVNLA